ncbi:CLUMA_CG007511, isoform A [Clunio marinus]|uniref:CLUMA_CG007511, isoform A n=1 Tax=Clunio marinus TaxID=568069 RepID=A0A1J1I6F2_9DIPT|nr:CLUMA_CG007511, isoform A [Clunio marinus]
MSLGGVIINHSLNSAPNPLLAGGKKTKPQTYSHRSFIAFVTLETFPFIAKVFTFCGIAKAKVNFGAEFLI